MRICANTTFFIGNVQNICNLIGLEEYNINFTDMIVIELLPSAI